MAWHYASEFMSWEEKGDTTWWALIYIIVKLFDYHLEKSRKLLAIVMFNEKM